MSTLREQPSRQRAGAVENSRRALLVFSTGAPSAASTMRRGRAVLAVLLIATVAGCASDGDEGGGAQGGASPDAGPACTPRNESPDVGPSGYRLDGWQWTRHGVLFEDETAGETDGYIAPAVSVVGDTLHLWVTRKQGVEHRIWHSSSVDGVSFSPLEPTVGLEGEDIIAYPTVLHDGTRFRMWYGSGSLDHAESSDGVRWTMVATNVLGPGESTAFDGMTVLYPSVGASADGLTMLYTGFDGQRFAIGRATSPDGIAWTRTSTSALLAPGAASEFDNHAVAQPCIAPISAGLSFWYGGYDTSVANPGPYRIGLAAVSDDGAVVRLGVTLDLEPSGVEAYSTRDPAVAQWQGHWWMAYVAMGDDRRYRIATATSETCGD